MEKSQVQLLERASQVDSLCHEVAKLQSENETLLMRLKTTETQQTELLKSIQNKENEKMNCSNCPELLSKNKVNISFHPTPKRFLLQSTHFLGS